MRRQEMGGRTKSFAFCGAAGPAKASVRPRHQHAIAFSVPSSIRKTEYFLSARLHPPRELGRACCVAPASFWSVTPCSIGRLLFCLPHSLRASSDSVASPRFSQASHACCSASFSFCFLCLSPRSFSRQPDALLRFERRRIFLVLSPSRKFHAMKGTNMDLERSSARSA